jgi:hypothetical protein
MKEKSRIDRHMNRDRHWMPMALRVMLPTFALLFVLAMIYDALDLSDRIESGEFALRRDERIARDIARLKAGLKAEAIQGPADKFQFVPPAGWLIDPLGNEGYFDLTFRSPEGMEINLLASEVDYNDFETLRENVERKEEQVGFIMHIEEGIFLQYPAVYRNMKLETQRVHMIDFLANGRAHHLMFAAPYELFDDYIMTIRQVLETYRPGPAPSAAQV